MWRSLPPDRGRERSVLILYDERELKKADAVTAHVGVVRRDR
ncbi:MAG TPA: hypothetical protein VM184_04555 [Gaiellaceae bacterium]|nr:hypothetical protein [Gaiellaceae bacterium]